MRLELERVEGRKLLIDKANQTKRSAECKDDKNRLHFVSNTNFVETTEPNLLKLNAAT